MEQAYITLTQSQWKDLHNALCHAQSQVEQLFSVLKDGGKALDAISKVRDALAPAYQQDETAFDRKMDYYDTAREQNKFQSIWSLYDETDVGSFDQPHPYTNATKVIYSLHWGNGPIEVDIKGPLWIDLYRAADQAIRQSGDGHHIYIEQFCAHKNGPEYLELTTGS